MKALQKASPQKGCKIIEAPVPKAKDDYVVCKVLATSICGTDVHIYNWDRWAQNRIKPPMIFGHEFCGEVVEAGPEVRNIKVGDRVSAETHIPCHSCKQCKNGKMHICKDLKILGVDINGCFAEYATLPEICCVKTNPALPPEICSVMEPFGNAVHAVSRSNVKDKDVSIVGDGPIGLFTVIVARALGARRIFAVGAQDYRLSLMKKLGPDYLFDARKHDVVKEIMSLTDGDGVDITLEMSGAPAAIFAGIKSTTPGGTLTLFGIPSKPVEIDLAGLIFKEIQVTSIVGRHMFDTWDQVNELLNSGKVDLRPLLTHTFPLEKIDTAMELLRPDNIQAGKIVLIP
ncbi:MAG: L-threonine 3-dehydrogenase [Deltaproteobacteria bacterium CG11_big_fil_rev_8_21_14_0_20_49_13]|nr:MAG: L-threonine 3-dehydrogenase [Deltaproteobacteria bacterium CG11_big_fil_rev_8_21_14_0_20_49_13]